MHILCPLAHMGNMTTAVRARVRACMHDICGVLNVDVGPCKCERWLGCRNDPRLTHRRNSVLRVASGDRVCIRCFRVIKMRFDEIPVFGLCPARPTRPPVNITITNTASIATTNPSHTCVRAQEIVSGRRSPKRDACGMACAPCMQLGALVGVFIVIRTIPLQECVTFHSSLVHWLWFDSTQIGVFDNQVLPDMKQMKQILVSTIFNFVNPFFFSCYVVLNGTMVNN